MALSKQQNSLADAISNITSSLTKSISSTGIKADGSGIQKKDEAPSTIPAQSSVYGISSQPLEANTDLSAEMPLFNETIKPADRLRAAQEQYQALGGIDTGDTPGEAEAEAGDEMQDLTDLSGLEGLDPFYNAYQDYAAQNLDGLSLVDFMTGGTGDQWYDYINSESIRPYYENFGDLSDRSLFDDWYTANQAYTLEDVYGGNDDELFRRVYGDDAQAITEINNYLASQGYFPSDAEGNALQSDDPNEALGVLNYLTLIRYLNAFGGESGLSPEEINVLAALDGLEWGQGDGYDKNAADRTNVADNYGTVDLDAYEQWGVPQAGLPGLLYQVDPTLNYRSKSGE